ncbi:MAG: capping complex subunit for YIEGIA [Peptococcales bacterium]
MGREPRILAYLTLNKNRFLGGEALSLLAENEEELKIMVRDMAEALKADVSQMQNGDYLILLRI